MSIVPHHHLLTYGVFLWGFSDTSINTWFWVRHIQKSENVFSCIVIFHCVNDRHATCTICLKGLPAPAPFTVEILNFLIFMVYKIPCQDTICYRSENNKSIQLLKKICHVLLLLWTFKTTSV